MDVAALNAAFAKYPVSFTDENGDSIEDKGWSYGVWYCGTSFTKVKLYGQYPPTFLRRAIALFPRAKDVLHAPSGSLVNLPLLRECFPEIGKSGDDLISVLRLFPELVGNLTCENKKVSLVLAENFRKLLDQVIRGRAAAIMLDVMQVLWGYRPTLLVFDHERGELLLAQSFGLTRFRDGLAKRHGSS